jgi:hypothetical protein
MQGNVRAINVKRVGERLVPMQEPCLQGYENQQS